jgi:hypothetical protein
MNVKPAVNTVGLPASLAASARLCDEVDAREKMALWPIVIPPGWLANFKSLEAEDYRIGIQRGGI